MSDRETALRQELVEACRKFGRLLGAGVGLAYAIGAVIEEAKDATLQVVLHDLRAQLDAGSSLSEAVARHDALFPPSAVALVEAGETQGRLDAVLEDLALGYEDGTFQVGRPDAGPLGLAEDASSGETLWDGAIEEAMRVNANLLFVEPAADGYLIRRRRAGAIETAEMLSREAGQVLLSEAKKHASRADLGCHVGHVDTNGAVGGVRVSVVVAPTVAGERAVFRLWGAPKTLDDLGYPPRALEVLRSWSERPAGVLLIAGPADSGVTSTFYACMRAAATERVAITLEDPVEARLDGVQQLTLGERSHRWLGRAVTGEASLGAEVVGLGELSTGAVARAAFEAALAGRLVIAGIAAADAAEALVRVARWDVPPWLLRARLVGVAAQRLMARASDATSAGAARAPVVELLEPTPALWESLSPDVTPEALRETSREAGHHDLRTEAEARINAGEVAPEALERTWWP